MHEQLAHRAHVPPVDASSQKNDACAFRSALLALKAQGVRVCLLRDDPQDYAGLRELDVLVRRKDMRAAISALRDAGWEPLPGAGSGPLKRQFVIFESGALRKMDLHGALVSGGLVYADEDWFWSHVRPVETGEAHVPNAAAYAFHCILHVVLGKQRLDDKHRTRLLDALAQSRRETLLKGAAAFALESLIDEVLCDPLGVLSDERRVGRLRGVARRRLATKPANAGRLCLLAYGRFATTLRRARPRLLIAVIGPDGAGKTSFIAALRAELRSAFEFDARPAYMGPWDMHLLPTSRLLARVDASPRDVAEPWVSPKWRWRILQAVDSSGRLRRTFYYANLPFEMWARHLFRIKRQHVRGRPVITDRYVYDLLVGYRNETVTNSPRLRDAICSLCPRPDVTILLHDDPDRIFARKPEYPAPVLRRALEAYRAIGETRQIAPIRTDAGPEALASAFVTRHWRSIVRRHMAGDRKRVWDHGPCGDAADEE